jgi:hypothetical protein
MHSLDVKMPIDRNSSIFLSEITALMVSRNASQSPFRLVEKKKIFIIFLYLQDMINAAVLVIKQEGCHVDTSPCIF